MKCSCKAIFVICLLTILVSPTPCVFAQQATGYLDMMEQVFVPVCLKCHNQKLLVGSRHAAPAEVDFNFYTMAYIHADSGNALVQLGAMPPVASGMELPSSAKATFQTWIDSGKPVGRVVVFKQVEAQLLSHSCTTCHDHLKTGDERNDAPANVNFSYFNASKEKAIRANYRIQQGTMPPESFEPISENQKQLFQDWLWLDCPSGEAPDYAGLNNMLESYRCLYCHTSIQDRKRRAPIGVDFETYELAASFAVRIHYKFQYATGRGDHGIPYKEDMNSFLDWIYAGLPEEYVEIEPVRDLDGNGVVECNDILWLVRHFRTNQYDNRYDIDRDGQYSVRDLLKLLFTVRKNNSGELDNSQ